MFNQNKKTRCILLLYCLLYNNNLFYQVSQWSQWHDMNCNNLIETSCFKLPEESLHWSVLWNKHIYSLFVHEPQLMRNIHVRTRTEWSMLLKALKGAKKQPPFIRPPPRLSFLLCCCRWSQQTTFITPLSKDHECMNTLSLMHNCTMMQSISMLCLRALERCTWMTSAQ